MLLPQEPHAVEHLPGALGGGVETRPQLGVLALEFPDVPGGHRARLARPRCAFELLHARLGLQRPTPEASQLVGEVPDELVELMKGLLFRTFAV